MGSHFFTALSCALLLGAEARASAEDSCTRALPQGLQEAAQRQYPEYRLPVASDNDPDDIRYNQKEGGSGCLGVSVGRYRGGQSTDYALLLTSRGADQNVLLVVGSHTGSRWRLELLRNWGAGGRSVLYVASAPPGKHARWGPLEAGSAEPGEVERFTSKLPGVSSGRVQSSEVAYFFTGKAWVHVWLSD